MMTDISLFLEPTESLSRGGPGTATDYREYRPHSALTPFVDRFWTACVEANAAPRRILPDGCIDFVLDLTGAETIAVVGTMTRATTYDPRAIVRLAAVRFRPGGAAPFLKAPAHELTDRVVTPDDVGAKWLAEVFREAREDPRQAIAVLEGCLLNRLGVIRKPDPLIAHAAARLFGRAPSSIAELSREMGFSRQHLGRLFRSQVGISPKQLARVARLQRACGALLTASRQNSAELASQLGYFDQAHMARDFRTLAGVNPDRVRASRGFISAALSLFTEPGSIFPIQPAQKDG